MKGNNKKRISIITLTLLLVVFTIGITYAFITQVLTGEKQVVINAGVLDLVLEEENEITISDALPMYDQVGMIQEDVFVFRLVNKTANDTKYVLKIQEIGTGTLSKTEVKYGLIKNDEIKSINLLSSLVDMTLDKGIIAGSDTIDYALRLWIDSSVTEIKQIEGKSLSLRLVVEAKQEIEGKTGSVTDIVFENSILGENCKTYDDGVDTFLVGQCSNNYLWYSGKLWRVVLKNNETGAVKMVTDNVMATLAYNAVGNTSFEGSYMDQWLTQEFLPTLHDYENYLVTTSVWNTTLDTSNSPTRPTGSNTVTKTVGLLNLYEYYTTYANSDGLANASTGYLKKGEHWWLITPYDSSNLRFVENNGNIILNGKTSRGLGVRPSVNLKSDIQIESGIGTEDDPYILEGDMQEPINGTTLLSTRYSGEYIIFNKELYRIVGVEKVREEQLTKITAVDEPSAFSSNQFSSYVTHIGFANSIIEADLENYYQQLEKNTKNMIKESTPWYLGWVGDAANYKASMCATIDATKSVQECTNRTTSATANIGLLRTGEMFTSQITRGTNTRSWLLTPYSNTQVRYIETNGDQEVAHPTDTRGARPSMYLKQNVVIASDNTGNGTYEYPYKIELRQNIKDCIAVINGEDTSGAEAPRLTSGMIPVVYDECEKKWLKADTSEFWYNYDTQNWANAVTVTEDTRDTYMAMDAGEQISMDDINTMWVWIPRYEYQYTNLGNQYAGGTQAEPGEIKINFISRNTTSPSDSNIYRIPEGFKFGDENIPGFWMGKFETSTLESCIATTDDINTGCDLTTLTPQVKPNVTSWRGARISTFFEASRLMQSSDNASIYGFDEEGTSSMDTHVLKNTEWGIVAILSQSKYGKYGNKNYTGANKEVYQNKSSEFITGSSNGTASSDIYANNQKTYNTPYTGYGASTTGTIYGVYDMNGGTPEYVMGNLNNISGNSTTQNSGFCGTKGPDDGTCREWPDAKYYDLYLSSTDSNAYKFGDTTYENKGWYNDYYDQWYVNTGAPWFGRGGYYEDSAYSGVFNQCGYPGYSNAVASARLAIKP